MAAAVAEGTTTFDGAGELRLKESDRVATIVSELSALGATVEPTDDGLVVKGGGAACAAARCGPTATTGWRWRWRWRPWPPRATP